MEKCGGRGSGRGLRTPHGHKLRELREFKGIVRTAKSGANGQVGRPCESSWCAEHFAVSLLLFRVDIVWTMSQAHSPAYFCTTDELRVILRAVHLQWILMSKNAKFYLSKMFPLPNKENSVVLISRLILQKIILNCYYFFWLYWNAIGRLKFYVFRAQYDDLISIYIAKGLSQSS